MYMRDKNNFVNEKNKSCEHLIIHLQNSAANPADFHPNWAGLDVISSRQIEKGFPEFFPLSNNNFILILKV